MARGLAVPASPCLPLCPAYTQAPGSGCCLSLLEYLCPLHLLSTPDPCFVSCHIHVSVCLCVPGLVFWTASASIHLCVSITVCECPPLCQGKEGGVGSEYLAGYACLLMKVAFISRGSVCAPCVNRLSICVDRSHWACTLHACAVLCVNVSLCLYCVACPCEAPACMLGTRLGPPGMHLSLRLFARPYLSRCPGVGHATASVHSNS